MMKQHDNPIKVQMGSKFKLYFCSLTMLIAIYFYTVYGEKNPTFSCTYHPSALNYYISFICKSSILLEALLLELNIYIYTFVTMNLPMTVINTYTTWTLQVSSFHE